MLGIKVKIMLDWSKQGRMTPSPDLMTIHQPKEEEEYAALMVAAPAIEVPVA